MHTLHVQLEIFRPTKYYYISMDTNLKKMSQNSIYWFIQNYNKLFVI